MKTTLGLLIVLSACASCSHLKKAETLSAAQDHGRRSALHASLCEHLKEEGSSPWATDMYDVAFVDLNNDGVSDAITLATDWETGFIGSGGATMFVFAGTKVGDYRFISRSTVTRKPIHVRQTVNNGWRDLVVHTSGGGYPASDHVMVFDGKEYPLNPTMQPKTSIVESDELLIGRDRGSSNNSTATDKH